MSISRANDGQIFATFSPILSRKVFLFCSLDPLRGRKILLSFIFRQWTFSSHESDLSAASTHFMTFREILTKAPTQFPNSSISGRGRWRNEFSWGLFFLLSTKFYDFLESTRKVSEQKKKSSRDFHCIFKHTSPDPWNAREQKQNVFIPIWAKPSKSYCSGSLHSFCFSGPVNLFVGINCCGERVICFSSLSLSPLHRNDVAIYCSIGRSVFHPGKEILVRRAHIDLSSPSFPLRLWIYLATS